MIHIKRQILVAASDLSVCQEIQRGLQNDCNDVCYVTSSAEALKSYAKQDYFLVILDAQLPDMDSVKMLYAMRSSKHTPILLLTDPLSTTEIVRLLYAGADTYLEKPLNIAVCAAQANALIQLYIDADVNQQHKPIIYGSELIISPRYRQVMIDGQPLVLTRKEFDLIHYFASYPKQVFTCKQLYNQVWGDSSAGVVEDIVKSQIKRLRKKLSQYGKDYIQTEWGIGYKFVLPDDQP